MTTYQVTLPDGRTTRVEGDSTGTEQSGAVVIFREVFVMGAPRRIVAHRLAASTTVVPAQPAAGGEAG